jgi:hypothetical protein
MEILKRALKGLLKGNWQDSHLTPQVKEKYLQMVDTFCNSGMSIEDIFSSLDGFWPGGKIKANLNCYQGYLGYRDYSDAEKEKLAAISLKQGGYAGKEDLERLMKELN